MPGESAKRTIGVALVVSLVCSVLVSTTVFSLQRVQEEKARRAKIYNVLTDLAKEGEIPEKMYKKIERLLINLETGADVPEEQYTSTFNPQDFNVKVMAVDPEYSKEIPAEKDIARIMRMPKYMVVFHQKEGDAIDKYILPIYGKGLYSTLYGVIALAPDLKTIVGISFYEQAETPGLGGEVDNPKWKKSWKGKQAFDENGNLRIEVLKGAVDRSRPEAKYQIDGLSGATMTTVGVDQLVKFWLGNDGYGPYLKRVKEEGGHG
jgi:Na+-transporting NADH:ubiquinone oxidoreductase subunit C